MILANTLTTLTTMDTKALARVLDASGYAMCSFKTAKFVGITNSGDFCYAVTYYDDNGLGEATGKVFVKYDHSTHAMTADF